MTQGPLEKHTAVLRDRLSLAGARVADIGCGDGGLVRALTRSGAAVVGIDPQPHQLARAQAAPAAGSERYCAAEGQALPFDDASLDVVIYFNALHHVPVADQEAALAEAARVLHQGGQLYIQEPLAEGVFFEMVRPIEDETEVRTRAYEALQRAADGRTLAAEEEYVYRAPHRQASFEAFRDGMIAVDPARRPLVEAREESLRQSFMAAGEQRDGAFWFEIPSRLNLLRRV
ncbi:class I SAM-dependent methyltransferase [Pelagibius sp.]|uniref:class I SAM-dependent methyltransferase n=1 Tax=Pelagibius sp. TaxID=1931238 RepID=UPI0026226CB8|nr:class I SAM-dependent methyltransferase [Pelagibius sp.]